MKTFLTLLICLLIAFRATAGVKTDIAVEDYPGMHHVVNGRYFYDGVSTSGYPQYRANRSDDTFIAPQTIRFNTLLNRWELHVTRMVSGTPTSQLAATGTGLTATPAGRNWTVFYPTGVGLYTALKVYETVVHTTVSGYIYNNWSDGRSWSSGFVPRTYDNVIITKSFNVDMEGKCNNLKIVAGSLSSYTILTGILSVSAIRIHGKLEQEIRSIIDLPEIEFRGNDLQTISADLSIGYSIRAGRVLINNPQNIQMLTSFNFTGNSTGRPGSKCETRLVKGKVYIGSFVAKCENITGADASRFFITDGTGSLNLTARTGSDANFQFFPVGPSANRYTPMWVYFGSASREYSNMQAKATYNPSIFLPGNHVNILYTVNHGSLVPSPGTLLSWFYRFQWNAADATTGFDYSNRIEPKKWNSTSWTGGIAEGIATGLGPYQYNFSSIEGGAVSFGLHAIVGARIIAEEAEMNKSEIKLDYAPYPNPAPATGFHVNVNDPATARLRMHSLSGTTVDIATRIDSGHQLAVQPVQTIASGIYILQVNEGGMTRVHKVLVR